MYKFNPDLRLKPFQEVGVSFLTTIHPSMNGKGHKALLDDMGAGKTPQVCGALRKLKATRTLGIVPAPIKHTWARRLVEWGVTDFKDIFIVGSRADIIPATARHIIVNYDYMHIDRIYKQLKARVYDVVYCDEAQRLKSMGSKRSKRVLGGGAESLIARGFWKWLISGTLMPNRAMELYPALRALCPELIFPFTTRDTFGMRFCGGFNDEYGNAVYNGSSKMDELRDRISPFVLRRELKDVVDELPEVFTDEIFVDIGEMLEDETNTPLSTLRRLIGMKKLPYGIDFVNDHLKWTRDKIVVFAYHQDFIRGMTQSLNTNGIVAVNIYGETSPKNKEKALDDFVNDPQIRVLVAQVTSAGLGIDGLQTVCNHILFAELDWAPDSRNQAVGRLRRMGQTKDVIVKELIAENTCDEAMVASYHFKMKSINILMNSVKGATNMAELGLLERGVAALEAIASALASNGGTVTLSSNPKENGTKNGTAVVSSVGSGKQTDKAKNQTAENVMSLEDLKKSATAAIAGLGNDAGAKARVRELIATVAGVDKTDKVAPEKRAELCAAFEAALNDGGDV